MISSMDVQRMMRVGPTCSAKTELSESDQQILDIKKQVTNDYDTDRSAAKFLATRSWLLGRGSASFRNYLISLENAFIELQEQKALISSVAQELGQRLNMPFVPPKLGEKFKLPKGMYPGFHLTRTGAERKKIRAAKRRSQPQQVMPTSEQGDVVPTPFSHISDGLIEDQRNLGFSLMLNNCRHHKRRSAITLGGTSC